MKFLPRLLALALLSTASLRAGEPATKIFDQPATLVFLGDSITQNGRYQHIIQLALAARYPGADFWTVNKGWNGQEANHGEARWDWDVLPAKPDVVFIHFGMNDVRRLGYADGKTPDQKTRDAGAERYRKNLGSLIAKASGEGRRVVVLSPTLFDSTMMRDGKTDNPELEKELVRYSDIARELAAEHKLPFVDFQSAMRRVTSEMQAKDPKSGLTLERVHPNESGHLVMAWELLRTLDFDPVVYEVELQANGEIVKSEKAEIAGMKSENGGLSWEQKESSFPIPVQQPALKGLELVPFHDDLNHMILRVKGLAAGDYEVRVDDEPVAKYTAAELSEGVNLAKSPALPHYRDLAPLREALHKKKAARESMLREVAHARAAFKKASVGESIDWRQPEVESLQTALAEYVEKKGGEASLDLRDKKIVENARRIFPMLPELLSENEAERARLREQPASARHRYEIVPAK